MFPQALSLTILGFRVLGFWGLGFWGFRVLGLGFRAFGVGFGQLRDNCRLKRGFQRADFLRLGGFM